MNGNSIFSPFKKMIDEQGIAILDNTRLAIAFLSDYAPGLIEEQRIVRLLLRNDGAFPLKQLINNSGSVIENYENLCKAIGKSEKCTKNKVEDLHFIKSLIEFCGGKININDEELFDAGMSNYRKMPKDEYMPSAVLLLIEAGNRGNGEAYYYSANSLIKGKGLAKDLDLGMEYLEKAAQMKCEKAAIEYADLLKDGEDYVKKAKSIMKYLQEIGSATSEFMIAELYRKNYENEKAIQYYLSAAEKDNIYAMYEIALAYATGQGIGRNIEEATKWLKKAARYGHIEAQKKLEALGETWN